MWGIPLRGDDFWLIFTLHGPNPGAVLPASRAYMWAWMTSGPHFNPVSQFFDAVLKGSMQTTQVPLLDPSAVHYGALLLLCLVAMVMAAHLVSRLLGVGGVVASAATAALPLSLGFMAFAQVTAVWSQYDPLVSHPAYGALPTAVGLAYLAVAVAALASTRSRHAVIGGSFLGVLGFLTYDGFVIYIATAAVIAWIFRASWAGGRRRLWSTLSWLTVPPLVTLITGRLIVATHDVDYTGTDWSLDPVIAPSAWATSIHTSAPASTWGLASSYVPAGALGKYALAAGLLGALSFAGWAIHALRSRSAQPPGPPARFQPALGVFAALAAFAPVPYVVSGHSTYLLTPGCTYMHSLALLWAWAMAFSVLAIKALQLRQRRVVLPALAVVLAIVIVIQVNANRRIADHLIAEPINGVDVMKALGHGGPATEAERCATLITVGTSDWIDLWLPGLNKAYDDRFGTPYCDSLG